MKTAKDFLTANKSQVISSLKNSFYFDKVEIKELAEMYFNFIMQSDHYCEWFTLKFKKNQIKDVIESSIKVFKIELKEKEIAFGTNFDNKNKFSQEREAAARESISY
jgi:hypothetical protein